MFAELMPLIQNRPLTITVAAVDDKHITVNVVPKSADKDKAANKEIGHTHSKEVAAIPDTAIQALTTPLSVTGTPEEIDAQFAETLTDFTSSHVGLQNSYDVAALAIKDAVKAIDEREKLKKERDKAANKKPAPGKAEEKEKPEDTELPSLFTTQNVSPAAVSANDASSKGVRASGDHANTKSVPNSTKPEVADGEGEDNNLQHEQSDEETEEGS
jgi:PRTRC genetic system protein E